MEERGDVINSPSILNQLFIEGTFRLIGIFHYGIPYSTYIFPRIVWLKKRFS